MRNCDPLVKTLGNASAAITLLNSPNQPNSSQTRACRCSNNGPLVGKCIVLILLWLWNACVCSHTTVPSPAMPLLKQQGHASARSGLTTTAYFSGDAIFPRALASRGRPIFSPWSSPCFLTGQGPTTCRLPWALPLYICQQRKKHKGIRSSVFHQR